MMVASIWVYRHRPVKGDVAIMGPIKVVGGGGDRALNRGSGAEGTLGRRSAARLNEQKTKSDVIKYKPFCSTLSL